MRALVSMMILFFAVPTHAQKGAKTTVRKVSSQAGMLKTKGLDLGGAIEGVKRRMSALERSTKDKVIREGLRSSLEELRLVQQALGGLGASGPLPLGPRTPPQPCVEQGPPSKPAMKAQVVDLENALLGARSDKARTAIWTLAVRTHAFRVTQLKSLVRSFQSDQARAEALALAYERTVDPRRFYETLELLKDDAAQEALIQQIDGHRTP